REVDFEVSWISTRRTVAMRIASSRCPESKLAQDLSKKPSCLRSWVMNLSSGGVVIVNLCTILFARHRKNKTHNLRQRFSPAYPAMKKRPPVLGTRGGRRGGRTRMIAVFESSSRRLTLPGSKTDKKLAFPSD